MFRFFSDSLKVYGERGRTALDPLPTCKSTPAFSFATSISIILLFTATAAPHVFARHTIATSKHVAHQAAASRTITVRTGDTINTIAERLGISPTELARVNGLTENSRLRKGTRLQLPAADSVSSNAAVGEVIGNRITLADGYTFEADQVWKQGDEIWYSKGNITRALDREVRSIKPIVKQPKTAAATTATLATQPETATAANLPVWIHLVDGAKFRVDELQQSNNGVWYSRNNVSIFLDKDRIAKIEVEKPKVKLASWRPADWTSGNLAIDQMIRVNGERYGIDPYLVFLVIERESRFHTRAVSPKGALGLMQLMPGTARRLGVSRPFDPAQNIKGGTQYLRELMDMFGGQVNLVLASYNAGEGAVMKYGRNVPPYRETREYVNTIGKRYGLAGREAGADNQIVPPPQR
ncbi:MAG: transglycosylase SLT domain-containing protein [Pyrinomonadaceae bacterium]